MIKAIETEYNGYKFRSRLEARWAVFFDALGVKYEYEPEGFNLGNGRYYLPDFRVKCWGTRGEIEDKPFDLYIEVKGKMTYEDAEKIKDFVGNSWPSWETVELFPLDEQDDAFNKLWEETESTRNKVLIVGNIPDEGCSHSSSDLGAYEYMDGQEIYPFNYELIDGDYFAAYPAAHQGKFFLWGDDSNYIWNVSEVETAYRKARQARFEHGQKPII